MMPMVRQGGSSPWIGLCVLINPPMLWFKTMLDLSLVPTGHCDKVVDSEGMTLSHRDVPYQPNPFMMIMTFMMRNPTKSFTTMWKCPWEIFGSQWQSPDWIAHVYFLKCHPPQFYEQDVYQIMQKMNLVALSYFECLYPRF